MQYWMSIIIIISLFIIVPLPLKAKTLSFEN